MPPPAHRGASEVRRLVKGVNGGGKGGGGSDGHGGKNPTVTQLLQGCFISTRQYAHCTEPGAPSTPVPRPPRSAQIYTEWAPTMTSSMTIFAALLGSALGGYSLSNELIGNFVVLPEQRVLLCTIDKCANTLLAYAAARVSGISSVHKIGASRDNTYAKVRYTGSAEDVAQLLFDPQANTGWRRAVVLRDPVERFVSAYVSKCLQCNATIGGDGCYNCHSALGLPRRVDRVPTLAETVDALTRIGPRRVSTTLTGCRKRAFAAA